MDDVPSPTFELFRSAIRKRQQILCTYQGIPREVCPHAIGWKHGAEHAMTFQFGGQTSKGWLRSGGDWRCMDLRQVRNVTVRDGTWHTGTNHSRRQTCVDQIAEEVAY